MDANRIIMVHMLDDSVKKFDTVAEADKFLGMKNCSITTYISRNGGSQKYGFRHACYDDRGNEAVIAEKPKKEKVKTPSTSSKRVRITLISDGTTSEYESISAGAKALNMDAAILRQCARLGKRSPKYDVAKAETLDA